VNCAATTTCTCVIWTALPALHLPTGTRRGYYQQTASSATVHQVSSTSINHYSPSFRLHPHKPAQPTLPPTNQHSHQRNATMQETDLHYPPQTCPFCTIAAAFPFPSLPPSSSSPNTNSPPPTPSLWKSSSTLEQDLLKDSIPKEEESDPEKTSPSSFVVLRSRDVVAFLDILPMTGGHLLVTTRQHKVKVADMEAVESREIGELRKWML